jgi:hypothetical protein
MPNIANNNELLAASSQRSRRKKPGAKRLFEGHSQGRDAGEGRGCNIGMRESRRVDSGTTQRVRDRKSAHARDAIRSSVCI